MSKGYGTERKTQGVVQEPVEPVEEPKDQPVPEDEPKVDDKEREALLGGAFSVEDDGA